MKEITFDHLISTMSNCGEAGYQECWVMYDSCWENVTKKDVEKIGDLTILKNDHLIWKKAYALGLQFMSDLSKMLPDKDNDEEYARSVFLRIVNLYKENFKLKWTDYDKSEERHHIAIKIAVDAIFLLVDGDQKVRSLAEFYNIIEQSDEKVNYKAFYGERAKYCMISRVIQNYMDKDIITYDKAYFDEMAGETDRTTIRRFCNLVIQRAETYENIKKINQQIMPDKKKIKPDDLDKNKNRIKYVDKKEIKKDEPVIEVPQKNTEQDFPEDDLEVEEQELEKSGNHIVGIVIGGIVAIAVAAVLFFMIGLAVGKGSAGSEVQQQAEEIQLLNSEIENLRKELETAKTQIASESQKTDDRQDETSVQTKPESETVSQSETSESEANTGGQIRPNTKTVEVEGRQLVDTFTKTAVANGTMIKLPVSRNLRSSENIPEDFDSNCLGELSKGAEITILSYSNGWYKVSYVVNTNTWTEEISDAQSGDTIEGYISFE